MDFNLTRLPLLRWLTLLAPSGALGGLPAFGSGSSILFEFPALVWVWMPLLAMGAWLGHLALGAVEAGFGVAATAAG